LHSARSVREGHHSSEPYEILPPIGFLLLAAVSLFWGFNYPVMKIALKEVPPWTFRTLCFVFGGSSLLALAKVNRFPLTIPRKELKPLILVALLNITGWHLCSAYGIVYIKAGRAALIGCTMPLWAAILGIFILGEKLSRKSLLGLSLGIAGLTILIGSDIRAIGAAPLGALFMLSAAISWGMGTVLFKYFKWTMPITLLAGWQTIFGGIPILIGALILEPITPLFNLSPSGTLALLYVIVLATIFTQWAWFKVLHLFPAAVAAIGTLAIPPVGVFSSAFVFGEPTGLQEFAALVLIVTALAIVMMKREGFSKVRSSKSR
jgi:drug/metabolite transporter (DMT)-like permease